MSVTANELLAVMGARELRDDTTVFTGVGAPVSVSFTSCPVVRW